MKNGSHDRGDYPARAAPPVILSGGREFRLCLSWRKFTDALATN